VTAQRPDVAGEHPGQKLAQLAQPEHRARDGRAEQPVAETERGSGKGLPRRAGDQRFAFDATLEDVARRQNVPTAEFAAKRREYRSVPALQGWGWWMVGTLYRPLLLGLFALVPVFALDRLVRARAAPGFQAQAAIGLRAY